VPWKNDDLTKLGHQNVRRHQLGAPNWRALGGVMQVEKPALLRLLAQDATSVLIDARAEAGLSRAFETLAFPGGIKEVLDIVGHERNATLILRSRHPDDEQHKSYCQ
jgi:hypothetical protein